MHTFNSLPRKGKLLEGNNKETKSQILKQIEEIEQLKDVYETMKLTNTRKVGSYFINVQAFDLFRLSLARGLTSELAKISKSPIHKNKFKVKTPYIQ